VLVLESTVFEDEQEPSLSFATDLRHVAAMKPLQFMTLVGAISLALTGGAVAENVQKLLTDAQTAYMRGEVESAKATFQMVNKLDPKNQTAIAFLRRIQVEQAAKGGGGSVEKKFAAVILPQVEWRDATLRETLEFLRKKVNEAPGNKPQVNFVLQVPEERLAAARITLSLSNLPFTEVLRYVGGMAGVSFTYDQYAILVKPAAAAPTATNKASPQAP